MHYKKFIKKNSNIIPHKVYNNWKSWLAWYNSWLAFEVAFSFWNDDFFYEFHVFSPKSWVCQFNFSAYKTQVYFFCSVWKWWHQYSSDKWIIKDGFCISFIRRFEFEYMEFHIMHRFLWWIIGKINLSRTLKALNASENWIDANFTG